MSIKFSNRIIFVKLTGNTNGIQARNVVTLAHMFMPTYPGKKVARPQYLSFSKIWTNIQRFHPDIIHITGDAFAPLFALTANSFHIPIVGSFHTDLVDLVSTHHAYEFQKWSIILLEYIDSLVLDSCATTSPSFAVC